MIISRKVSKIVLFLFIIGVFSIGFYSCGNDDGTNGEEKIDENIDKEIEDHGSTTLQFEGALFSIPSPYEIAFLVKNQRIDYNKEFLNPVNRSHNYVNNYKKALNLGVYGADLGYLNIYEQTPDAVSYFSAIKILSQELDISNAFNNETISRIEKNMGNKDSLLYIISNTYREADKYLKDNNRNDLGVLILTGGWLESFHILVQIAQNDKNPQIIKRIGEQKYPLENLITILNPFYNESPDYAKLIDELVELAYIFDGIDVEYTYIKPDVDVKNKLTIINSTSELVMSDEQLDMISEKLTEIRNNIIE
jgi:hypothetical protein